MDRRPHVVIVGGGFAGLNCAKGLKHADVRVTLIDRRNYHLFQPLLYQVATASLSPADIASPIRTILRHQSNAQVWMADVEGVDLDAQRVELEKGASVHFDYLVLATGAKHAYFGHDEWSEDAPGLKTVDDATEIRRRFLLAFESAEREADPAHRRRLLSFVIVGAGPTGVELAGAMAEIARHAMPRDFRSVDTKAARIILLEGQDRVLPGYPAELSEKARETLEKLGVEVRTESFVTDIRSDCVAVGDERIDAENVFWAAGVSASRLGAGLGAETDGAGRVKVEPDCSIAGHPNVFVVGDLATLAQEDGSPVPGVAQGAIQMGKHAARMILADVENRQRSPFRYNDKGDLATIGRAAAVARIGSLRFAGLPAWLLWVLIHISYLIGFRNRLLVMIQWAWAYVTYQRGIRLITGDRKVEVERSRDPEGDPPSDGLQEG